MTMRMRMIQMLVIAVLGASIHGLYAADELKKPGKRFWFRPRKDAELVVVSTLTVMDQNKDGGVDSGEFYEHVKTRSFRRLDANGDGKVARAEWLAVETGPDAGELFKSWDKDGDGDLTLKEFKDTPDAMATIGNLFKTLDVDGDGKLTTKELDVEVK